MAVKVEASELYDTLLGQGMSHKVATKLTEINDTGLLTSEQLDDRATEALKEFSEDDACNILEQFSKSDLSHVQNKSAFLCGVMKTYRAKMKNKEMAPQSSVAKTTSGAAAADNTEVKTGPNDEKVKALLDRTGYTLDITTGQRKYGGPPPDWEGLAPGMGEKKFCSQIFIGKLPRDMYEDELVPLFEQHGDIYDLRIMVDPFTGLNKGFGFCTYTTREGAQAAVKAFEKLTVRDGKKLGVCLSQANNRLFVGSIPKQKSKKEIFKEFAEKVECLNDVIVYISAEDKTKNRGFAFLEFNTHKDASLARRRLMSGKVKVFGNISPSVDWADPVEEPNDEVMSKVKVVYVRNLSPAIEETRLNELFKQYGSIEKVKKIKDYAFIHFEKREDAMKAIEELDCQELDDLKIEVSLAKPQAEKKEGRRGQSGFGALNISKQQAAQQGRGGRGGPPPRGGRGGRGGGSIRGASRGGYLGYEGGGGYDDGYYGGGDYEYDSYYGPPPPARGGRGGRGGPPRGMPPRGGFRGAPRGGPMRGGPRGGPPRGGPPRGGRGGARGAPLTKRKAADYGVDAGGKRKFGGGPSAGGWSSQPIAQQPLNNKQYYTDDYSGGDQWYNDSYGNQWN